MKKRPITGIVHPHLKILKKSGYADVARVLEYDGDVMSIPAERWDEVAGFLRAMPYGSTLRDIAEHRARWVRQRLRENPPFYAHNLRFIRDAMVVGEGAKYVKIGGKYIPFVSRSATDRLEDGRILNVVIKEGRADIWDPSIYGYPPGNWEVVKNPPMYAHNLYEKKTHGLNLKQMRRLYAMVSRGNQKAITYARNVLGIPFSESPSQVKAVVLHHVRDLAERRGLKRNAPWSKVRNAFAKAGFQFHAYGKVDDPATGKKLYDYYKGDSLTDGQKKIIQSLIPEVEFGGSRSQYAPEIRRPVVMFPVKRGLRRNPARSHRERIAIDTVRHPMKGYFLGGPDLAESVRYLRGLGYSIAQLKKLNPEVEDILEGRKSILPNRRRRRK